MANLTFFRNSGNKDTNYMIYHITLTRIFKLYFRNSGNKDTNYMLAILDSRMKIVAHERFQYVLLKKFGESLKTK